MCELTIIHFVSIELTMNNFLKDKARDLITMCVCMGVGGGV